MIKKNHVLLTMIILSTINFYICNKDNHNDEIAALAAQSFIDQFNALAAAGIPQIAPAQIATISKSVIPVILPKQIAQLSSAQIQALTTNQIPALIASQIQAFTIPSTNTPAAINQLAAFTSAQLNAFTASQIPAFTAPQINFLTPALTSSQIQALTATQIASLSAPLAASIFAKLSSTQIQAITIDQIKGFTPAQIATITNAQIDAMTKPQLEALLAILQNPAIITTTNNPQLAIQIAEITKELNETPAAPATIKKAKKEIHYASENLDKLHIKGTKSLYDINQQTGAAKINRQADKDFKKLGNDLKKAFRL